MPLVEISWGIFYTGLISAMIIVFEYVQCAIPPCSLAHLFFKIWATFFGGCSQYMCLYKRLKFEQDWASTPQKKLFNIPVPSRDVTYHGWRKKGKIQRGVGAYLRCPFYISAFATRVLRSTYVCVKGERAWAPIFKHWFRKPFIFLLHSHSYICMRNWFFCTFLHSLKGVWHEIFDFRFFHKSVFPRP